MSSLDTESDINLLNKILDKLVLESSVKLKKKGYEYLRLLKLKRGAGLVNMSDTCAVVVCLNLATDKLGCTFDKPRAIQVAGVTKKSYTCFYHTVQKMLGLDKLLSVKDITVKLACSDISEFAQELIDRYVRNRDEGLVKCPPIDLSHPMYSCAAVLAACRHKKVRVNKSSLVEMCRVKAKDLDKLAGELAVLAEQTQKKPSRKRGHHLIDLVEQMVKDSQKTSINNEEVDNKEEEEEEKPQESFEEWKKRILSNDCPS